MSKETINLRVPSKPAAEYVEHGNFAAELIPTSVITVSDRRFADWLVVEFGCAEVGDKAAGPTRSEKKTTKKAKPQAQAEVSTSGSEITDDSGESQNDGGE